jgi:outer membrane protein OmpA-like peptidoglycan-associated protein
MFQSVTGIATAAVLSLSTLCSAQTGPQPIYRVTIVSRTTKAINYGHRSVPTEIDFRGTPILPLAHGIATVDNKGGSTLVDAHFKDVPAPTRFGAQYLTYVVWAISPAGHAENLGELVLNGSDKGKLLATTNLQTFALIVTAEPYYAVTEPSNVVVMENAVRPDTIGKIEEVNATYELMPRKEYTYDASAAPPLPGGPPVSMPQYEAILAVREAQNAIQLAIARGAQEYAPDRLSRAQRLLATAMAYPKYQADEVTSTAREAAQVASDARTIAVKRNEEARVAAEKDQALAARQQADQARIHAEEEAARARDEAEQAAAEQQQAQAAQDHAAAEAQALARERSTVPQPAASNEDTQRQVRLGLVRSLSGILDTRDTPRGVVVTVPDTLIGSGSLSPALARVASVIRGYPNLQVDVQAYTDRSGNGQYEATRQQADLVRSTLIADGVSYDNVNASGLGNTRPVASNATAAGRMQNRRVEIVITGQPIGPMATWERSYSLGPAR